MIRAAWIACLMAFATHASAEGEVRVRAALDPPDGAVLGQQVRLNITLLTDTWITTAARYPELSVPGAITLMPDAFGVNVTEREGGTTWSGQTRRYVIFPQRAGRIDIPPIEISLAVARNGRPSPLQTVSTQPVTLRVSMPADAGDQPFVTTSRYSLDGRWDQALENLETGDAITLTITQKADDVFALLLPAIEFPRPAGMAAYPAQPELLDNTNRGRYAAERRDSITYVLQEPGDVIFPALNTRWFNLRTRTMQTETLETIEFSVQASEAVLAEDIPPDPPIDSRRVESLVRTAIDWIAGNIVELSAAAVLLYLLLKLLVRALPRWLYHWRLARERRKASEASQFGRLLAAIASGDAGRSMAAFWRWWQYLQRDGIVARDGLTADVPAFREPDSAWLQFAEARYRDQDRDSQARLLRNLRNNVRHGRKQLLRGTLSSRVTVEDDRLNP